MNILTSKYRQFMEFSTKRMLQNDSVASHPPSIHLWQKGNGKINQNTITISGWNVNGFKSIIQKGEMLNFINRFQPDFFCLNETKVNLKKYEQSIKGKVSFPEYYQYWNFCKISAGYSGVAIYSKFKPVSIIEDFPEHQNDSLQGRLLTIEYERFYLINVYKPNSGPFLERLEYRTQKYDEFFNEYVKKLQLLKPVVIFGDMNVAHNQIDLAKPKQNKNKAGFTIQQRSKLTQLLKLNLIDSYRLFHPKGEKYTYWSYINGARSKNIGWRIDYVIVDSRLKIINANIHDDIMGSDHCPISVTIEIT